MEAILEAMKVGGWAASNVCFGSGGGLLQELNRDTLKCAFKASYAEVDGKARDVFKAPVTDPGEILCHAQDAMRGVFHSNLLCQQTYDSPIFFCSIKENPNINDPLCGMLNS